MAIHYPLLILLAALISSVFCATVPTDNNNQLSHYIKPGPDCQHGPRSRACWEKGLGVATDFDQKFPVSKNLVSYYFELTNGTCNPDGHGERICLLVNGQYPGPVLRARWGDTVQVTIKNSMQNNGTSLHFHGVRQYHTNSEDGVNGVTECPLAPGDTKVQTFQVTQFGTSWYHSHFSSQYGDGIIGPIVFVGPATADYDVDLGPYTLNEWYYQTCFQVNAIASQNLQLPPGPAQAPPIADNILINGTNRNASGGGRFNQVTVQSGKKYRLRLINMSVNQVLQVSLDQHVMQVITTDFVPIVPYETTTLLINVGQRYDVVINANQTAGNYWFRAMAAGGCLSESRRQGWAVWTYEGVRPMTPMSVRYPPSAGCIEPSNFVPYWPQNVPKAAFASSAKELDVSITKQVVTYGGDAIFVWALGNHSMNVNWNGPTLEYVMQLKSVTNISTFSQYPAFNVLPTASEGGWNYWIIQQSAQAPPIPHPIHLHGHDFFVLGQGSGTFNLSSASAARQLNWKNPVRRDTATMQADGWLALAFRSDNPGAWLMHCHIAFHASEGLAVQFLEAPGRIKFVDPAAWKKTCYNWKAYMHYAYYPKDDSGL